MRGEVTECAVRRDAEQDDGDVAVGGRDDEEDLRKHHPVHPGLSGRRPQGQGHCYHNLN